MVDLARRPRSSRPTSSTGSSISAVCRTGSGPTARVGASSRTRRARPPPWLLIAARERAGGNRATVGPDGLHVGALPLLGREGRAPRRVLARTRALGSDRRRVRHRCSRASTGSCRPTRSRLAAPPSSSRRSARPPRWRSTRSRHGRHGNVATGPGSMSMRPWPGPRGSARSTATCSTVSTGPTPTPSTPTSGWVSASTARVLFVADRASLIDALSITPTYLRSAHNDAGEVIDYRDWQMQLGRRFRSLKVWFVLRAHRGRVDPVDDPRPRRMDRPCGRPARLDDRPLGHRGAADARPRLRPTRRGRRPDARGARRGQRLGSSAPDQDRSRRAGGDPDLRRRHVRRSGATWTPRSSTA